MQQNRPLLLRATVMSIALVAIASLTFRAQAQPQPQPQPDTDRRDDRGWRGPGPDDGGDRWQGRRGRWREWLAQQQAASTRPSVPFAGTFSDDRVAITLNRANATDPACSGTIILGDRDRPAKQLPLTGEIHDGELSGKFQDGAGNAFPFSARIDDANLIFRTGAATYCLTDESIPRPPSGAFIRWGPSMGGIGLYFDQTSDRYFVATMVRPGAAADRAGMVPGDIITRIDDIDMSAQDLDTARRLIIGRIGTQVKLTVRHRDGATEDYKLIRQRLQQMNFPVMRGDSDDNRGPDNNRDTDNNGGNNPSGGDDRMTSPDRTNSPDRPK